MSRKNIFSEKTEVSVLVHTQSFLGNSDIFKYFHNVSKLEGINIFFMPLLKDLCEGIETGKYVHHREKNRVFSSLEFFRCSGVVKIHLNTDNKKTDDEYSLLTEESILRGECSSELFDYIVSDSAKANLIDCDVPVVSFSECREILRLKMAYCENYHVSEHFEIDEIMYYIYRHKKLFPSFQLFWSCSVKAQKLNWPDALDNRLDLMARCLDQCKISAYKKVGNNSIMQIKYHLSYLLLLITGTFDNLGWIINDLYKLELEKDRNGHFNVDLKKKVFYDSLKEKSVAGYNIISDTLFQNRLDAIRELRDRVVHRDFMRVYRGGRPGFENEVSYFDSDSLLYGKLQKAGFEDSDIAIKAGDHMMIYVIPFINFLEKITIEMVDNILKTITEDIYGKNETIELWKFFNFPCSPYVF